MRLIGCESQAWHGSRVTNHGTSQDGEFNEAQIISIAALAAGLLAGCGAARPSKYYQLTVPGGESVAARNEALSRDAVAWPAQGFALVPGGSHRLQLERVKIWARTNTSSWAEPPTEMLVDVLLRDLRASGKYRAVDVLRSNSHGDYILYGRLYDFKEVSGPRPYGPRDVDLELRETKTGATVWTHFYIA